jgi:hypothetical protein
MGKTAIARFRPNGEETWLRNKDLEPQVGPINGINGDFLQRRTLGVSGFRLFHPYDLESRWKFDKKAASVHSMMQELATSAFVGALALGRGRLADHLYGRVGRSVDHFAV